MYTLLMYTKILLLRHYIASPLHPFLCVFIHSYVREGPTHFGDHRGSILWIELKPVRRVSARRKPTQNMGAFRVAQPITIDNIYVWAVFLEHYKYRKVSEGCFPRECTHFTNASLYPSLMQFHKCMTCKIMKLSTNRRRKKSRIRETLNLSTDADSITFAMKRKKPNGESHFFF